MRAALALLLLAAVPRLAAAQDAHQWFRPGARVIAPGGLGLSISDTMGIPYRLRLPVLGDEAGTILPAVGRVFAALAASYADLKVPPALRDSSLLLVGNPEFSARFDLGGKRISEYLECGEDVNGIYADTYKISLTLVSFLTPLSRDSIELRSVLLGRAVNIPKAQSSSVCRDTGALALRIYQSVRKKLSKYAY